MTPTFEGEVQLAGWSESHNGGCKVTFWLSDSDDLEAFRAMTVRKGNTAGQRLACVLIEIGDDEQPVEPAKPRDQRGPLCREACDLCDMREFQLWAAMVGGYAVTSSANAKEYILMVCNIESRKNLDEIQSAADRFVSNIRIPFMRWQRERKAA